MKGSGSRRSKKNALDEVEELLSLHPVLLAQRHGLAQHLYDPGDAEVTAQLHDRGLLRIFTDERHLAPQAGQERRQLGDHSPRPRGDHQELRGSGGVGATKDRGGDKRGPGLSGGLLSPTSGFDRHCAAVDNDLR